MTACDWSGPGDCPECGGAAKPEPLCILVLCCGKDAQPTLSVPMTKSNCEAVERAATGLSPFTYSRIVELK